MEFFKNVALNLKATGPTAVLICWIGGIVLLGIFGNGEIALKGMNVLYIFGGVLIITMGQKI